MCSLYRAERLLLLLQSTLLDVLEVVGEGERLGDKSKGDEEGKELGVRCLKHMPVTSFSRKEEKEEVEEDARWRRPRRQQWF